MDAPVWNTRDGRKLSLRSIAGLTVKTFWHPIRRISDPFTFRLIGDYYRTDEQCCGAVTVVRGPTAAAIDGMSQLVNACMITSGEAATSRVSHTRLPASSATIA